MRTLAMALLAAALASATAGCGGAGKVGLPEGVPEDLPRPPEGVLRAAQDLGPRGLNLVWEVGGDRERLAAGMAERMEAAGWQPVAEVALERGAVRTWRKGGRTAAVAVAADGGRTLVSIGYLAPRGGAREGAGE